MARVDEILPWFTHNAGIHFSAPHGLEQYGGAAWGVRDVCQGSAEWLLAAGEFPSVRRLLAVVFAQQYPHGAWPQWFMHRPFHVFQQPHSHGDVCFWPVKALSDYVEATNDFEFLALGIEPAQHDLGEVARRARRRAGEDHVVHLLAAHRGRRLRAEHPGDGVDDVGLAAAVGADDSRQPRLDAQRGGLDEALEAAEA